MGYSKDLIDYSNDRDLDYEAWSNSLPSISDDDLMAMAEEDLRRRIKDSEAEVGPCGQREGW